MEERDLEIRESISNDFKFITKEGHKIIKSLNISKDKLIIKLELEQIKKYNYSKEYTLEQIQQISPIFALEDSLEDIDKLITESINNYGVHSLIDENNGNKLNLIIQVKVNSNLKEIKIELDKTDLSDEEYFSSIQNKIIDLLTERRKVIGIKSFDEICNEKFVKSKEIKQLEDLEVKAYNNLKIFKTFIESNLYLLSNSNIITDPEEIKILYEEIQKADKKNQIETNKNNKDFIPKSGDFVFKLVYRASRDGDDASEFHKRCDEIGPNVTLVKTEKNKRFGGFTFCNWGIPQKYLEKMKSNAGILKQDQCSFCFSLDLKKMYYHDDRQGKEDAIFCSNKFGPTFCSNIFAINNNMLAKGGYCTRKKTSCFTGQSKDYEISGEKSFNIKELEVYEIVYL
jgi:hypothetical protein